MSKLKVMLAYSIKNVTLFNLKNTKSTKNYKANCFFLLFSFKNKFFLKIVFLF